MYASKSKFAKLLFCPPLDAKFEFKIISVFSSTLFIAFVMIWIFFSKLLADSSYAKVA